MNQKPLIICLCGSTKFKQAFEKAIFDESCNGHIVLSVCCFTHADHLSLTIDQKKIFDALHFKKIDMADEILVINVGGYIGQSTQNEIDYAISLGKKIRFWEDFEV